MLGRNELVRLSQLGKRAFARRASLRRTGVEIRRDVGV